MNTFQWIALPVLSLVLLREVYRFLRGVNNRWYRLLRCCVWAAAIVAILQPNLAQAVANHVGIARGADLVFYVAILVFLGVAFSFYANHIRLQRQLTQLVRHLAILEAKRAGQMPDRPEPS